MATHKLTKNYKPRIVFNENFGIGDSENLKYLDSFTKWGMARIKKSAKPYHEKHLGVTDNGKKGKDVTVTFDELKQIIIDSNGVSPDGVKIYFGPLAYLNNPNRAIELGLMTREENSRKPSFDRKNSNEKKGPTHYGKNNIQLTTKGFNLGKGADDSYSSITQNVKVKVRGGIELILDNCSPQFLASYTQSLAI
jgi:hypothetical protein